MENTILENNLSAWEKKFCGSRVEIENKYKEWKNAKEPVPERSKKVEENRKRLKEHQIPFVEFYNAVDFKKDLDESIEGLDVIVVEDIIDSGNTLSRLIPMLKERKPASLKVTTLLDKPDRREVDDVNVDYVGFEIEDKFVVGYGLDYDQSYRDLPYIGIVEL